MRKLVIGIMNIVLILCKMLFLVERFHRLICIL